MPVHTLSESKSNNLYCHVYNKGIDDNLIFKEGDDCKVFLDFLKEYLSVPIDATASKKVFNIRGREFRGSPHQPKNYFEKIELVAYSLSPDHFHLILDVKHKDNLAGFIRSLCTRYSIYFNKKYQRVGSLFAGPYKSVFIKEDTSVLLLTKFLHTHGLSSYPEYLGTRVTPWIKPLPNLNNNYKNFVEEYKLSQIQTSLLDKISFDIKYKHVENKKEINLKPAHRIPEYIVLNTVFFFLLTLGIGNIASPKNVQYNLLSIISPKVSTSVLGIETKNTVSISIKDGRESIDIYKNDSVDSEKIGTAKNGALFDLVGVETDWYQIKLPNGSLGFVLSKYVKLINK